ncbi:hypothetical protein ACVW2A_002134 [Ewingella americana]
MALNLRVAFGGVIEHGDIGEDQRVGAQLRGHIHGALPALKAVRMGEGIDGNMQLATVAMHVIRRLLQFLLSKVQTGKMAGIGIVF